VTRGWKIAVGVVVAVVAFDLVLAGVGSLTGGRPGGPESSSYATGSDGDAAYASLLALHGHEVVRARRTPSATRLHAGETAFVLDPPFVLAHDAGALRRFVAAGGTLVAAPGPGRWPARLLGSAPTWSSRGVSTATTSSIAGVARVMLDGSGSWSRLGRTRAVLAGARPVAVEARVGAGRIVLLADSSPLQNGYLGRADDAAFALALARGHDAVFFETYHGYGASSGIDAIPVAWDAALAFGALAVLVFMLARVRRFGPPEPDARDLPPPRVEYVDAIASVLARTPDRRAAVDRLRREVRRRVASAAGLPPDADDAAVAAAATRLGLAADEIASVLQPAGDDLAVGRAVAHTARRRSWMS
jgi:hypothetical protein